jgi:hypothetical protein
MARANKITIRVETARRSQTIFWTSTGVEGDVVLNQTSGELLNVPLSTMTSSDAYWNAILTLVLAQIPA